ncbi:hypothetical protein OGZ02_15600 [Brachyspira hyodysenteriae]|nr:hypothetical protein [Brachyspira hyodysenteriae]MDA1470208.1 hypothetical protein [Brachyspira hyodysenteriae]
MHDPTCIAYLIDESCIETKDMYSEVEIRSENAMEELYAIILALLKINLIPKFQLNWI